MAREIINKILTLIIKLTLFPVYIVIASLIIIAPKLVGYPALSPIPLEPDLPVIGFILNLINAAILVMLINYLNDETWLRKIMAKIPKKIWLIYTTEPKNQNSSISEPFYLEKAEYINQFLRGIIFCYIILSYSWIIWYIYDGISLFILSVFFLLAGLVIGSSADAFIITNFDNKYSKEREILGRQRVGSQIQIFLFCIAIIFQILHNREQLEWYNIAGTSIITIGFFIVFYINVRSDKFDIV